MLYYAPDAAYLNSTTSRTEYVIVTLLMCKVPFGGSHAIRTGRKKDLLYPLDTWNTYTSSALVHTVGCLLLHSHRTLFLMCDFRQIVPRISSLLRCHIPV